jgi:hypothetical protein
VKVAAPPPAAAGDAPGKDPGQSEEA